MTALATETTTTVTTHTATMLAAVRHALLAVAKRPSVPVLSHLRVWSESGHLRVAAYDYDTAIIRHLDAEGAIEPMLLPGVQLRDALARLDQKQPVTLGRDLDKALITQGTRTVTLRLGDMADYPDLPAVPEGRALSVAGPVLASMVTGVGPFVGKDDMLPVLTAMHFKLDGDTLYAEATDRFRAAYMSGLVHSHVDTLDVIVHNMKNVATIMGKDDTVSVHVDPVNIVFVSASGTICQRLHDGDFPRLRALFPSEANTVTEFEPVAFLSALKFVEAGVRRNEGIEVSVADGRIDLRATNDDGETTDHIPAEITGEDVRTAFNPTFLTDVVKVFGKDNPVRMSHTLATKPAVFESDSIPNLRVLLMPRRLVS